MVARLKEEVERRACRVACEAPGRPLRRLHRSRPTYFWTVGPPNQTPTGFRREAIAVAERGTDFPSLGAAFFVTFRDTSKRQGFIVRRRCAWSWVAGRPGLHRTPSGDGGRGFPVAVAGSRLPLLSRLARWCRSIVRTRVLFTPEEPDGPGAMSAPAQMVRSPYVRSRSS